jgi:hypothetical protein
MTLSFISMVETTTTEWLIKRSLFRRRYNVYKRVTVDGAIGAKVWQASFRDRDDAIYWTRFGTCGVETPRPIDG